MKFFPLGSGAMMPGLGLGTWKADPGVVGEAVQSAIAQGYRHLDCAAIYGNEPEIGAALQKVFQGGEQQQHDGTGTAAAAAAAVQRNDLFLTSKLWNSEHAPSDVEPALRKTLDDLQTDYLDLYLIHWPVVLRKDAQTAKAEAEAGGASTFQSLEELPILDTWRALEDCVDKGLVRDIGVSNFSKKKLQALVQEARIKPSVNQIELHPYLQLQELVDYCASEGIHVTAYSPLGSNDRTPDMKREDEVPILQDATIASIAKKHSASSAQILIAWALQRSTSVIPKSVSPKRQAENLATTAAKFHLDSEDMVSIAALDKHYRYVDGSFWCLPDSPYTLENIWDEDETSTNAVEPAEL